MCYFKYSNKLPLDLDSGVDTTIMKHNFIFDYIIMIHIKIINHIFQQINKFDSSISFLMCHFKNNYIYIYNKNNIT